MVTVNSKLSLYTVSAARTAALGTADVMFYVNLGLAFFALITLAAIIALHKKTVCAKPLAIAAVSALATGCVMYFVQLGLYAKSVRGMEYAVYVCTAILGAAFVTSGVYFIMLARNAEKRLCIVTGIMCIVPPIGAVMSVMLSKRIQRDTPIKKRVFSGWAYTYAALGSFAEKNPAELIDGSGEEAFKQLTGKEAKRKLKRLKTAAHNAESQYKYASALVYYTPYKFKKAFRTMQKSAASGYAPALFNIGYWYETGVHIKPDYKKAREYYTRAANAGDGDAALRLAVIDIKSGNAANGIATLQGMADSGDLFAKYDIGVCYETGTGVDKDIDRAFEIYTDCANAGLLTAQKRIFAAASTDISSDRNGDYFRRITDRQFTDKVFSAVIDGLIEIKKRHAADASDKFIAAVKLGGRWEGVSRCLVGTLYIDCGASPEDKRNGADYIRSAFGLWRGAFEIYAAIPKKFGKARTKSKQ